jgi:hypothetical protein
VTKAPPRLWYSAGDLYPSGDAIRVAELATLGAMEGSVSIAADSIRLASPVQAGAVGDPNHTDWDWFYARVAYCDEDNIHLLCACW